MSLRSRTIAYIACIGLVACSGGGSSGKHKSDAGGGSGGDASLLDAGPDGSSPVGVAPGDPVDLNGDGKADGIAVDSDGDGVPDGVDTNGDGVVDEALPGQGPDSGGGTSTLPDAGPSPFPVNSAGQVLCGDVPCACSNGTDEDGDKLIDLADPECVSSWDNDEASLATGISGDNRDDACQDCFFDGNSGSGNDGCYVPSSCITEGNDSSGHGRCSSCEQTKECKTFCKAYTPNGCDCFGCCGVQLANGSVTNVMLGNGCNIDGNTVDGCTACVPNDSCKNECGRCELCPGKTVADLPADCTPPPTSTADGGPGTSADAGPGEPSYSCDDGAVRCGSGLPACKNGFSCDFGCCVLIPVF
jgi:hypothetical protein